MIFPQKYIDLTYKPKTENSNIFISLFYSLVGLVVQSLKDPYIELVLKFVALQLEKSRHLHFYLLWCQQMLSAHGQQLKTLSNRLLVVLRSLQKGLTKQQEDLGKV